VKYAIQAKNRPQILIFTHAKVDLFADLQPGQAPAQGSVFTALEFRESGEKSPANPYKSAPKSRLFYGCCSPNDAAKTGRECSSLTQAPTRDRQAG